MKDQILKIAGVKSEKEFYKKFPTEESFMAKHGKKLEKLAMGKSMVEKQLKQLTDFSNPPIAQDGLGNIANALGAFTKISKNTDGTTSATGGLGDFAANIFGKKAGGAKGLTDVGPNGVLGAGGKGLAAGAGAAGIGMLNAAPEILNGISAMKEQKNAIKQAEKQSKISGLSAQAAESKQVGVQKHNFVRPEDNLVQPDQLGSAQGTGTNFLQMKEGGEIQNTYAPYTLYDNLEEIPTAEFGDYFQSSGQAQIGGAAGQAIGNALFGPLGGMAGKFLGNVARNLLGGAADANKLARYQSETEKNTNRAASAGMLNSLQSQNSAYMKRGGWVSHDWQPQVITQFGEHPVSQLLKADPMMDTLRAGGHLKEYTPPSARAMYTGRDLPYQMEDGGYMAMGGALQTHWGGDAELMSYNPYIPGGGETVMFRGQSHDDTNEKGQSGIGITYGDNPVEVERGEPMTEMNNGGVVYGNLIIDKFAANQIEDPKAKGKKYKNYIADLSKTEAKQNKIMDKASGLALEANENTPFGRLALNSSQASIIGANMKLKDIAQKKQDAAAVQNAILDTADEMGLVADDLAKGKIKKAKFGGKFTAEDGTGPLTPEQRANASFSRPGDKIFEGSRTYFPERGQLPLFARILGAKPKPNYFNPELNNTLMNADDRSYSVGKPYNQEVTDNLMYATRNYSQYNPDFTNALMYNSPYIQPIAPKATSASQPVVSTVHSPETKATATTVGSTAKTTGSGKAKRSGKTSGNKVVSTKGNTSIGGPSEPKSVKLTDKRGADYNWMLTDKPLQRPTGMGEVSQSYSMPEGMATSNITGVDIFGNYTGPNEPFTEATSEDGNTNTNWKDIAQTVMSSAMPLFRPTDQQGLDPNQLMGEYYALSQNQLEPVQAQLYRPQLGGVMDVSYQDQLNEITAQSRAAERMAQNNPEAAANLFAQVAQAKNKVLAEQTRANMAGRKQVYDENRNLLNDAQLKNLQILDQQYQRQAQAKSNTKAQAQAALNSIADKIAKNKLENRQLGIYENLYNYRFDPQGRAFNVNAPAQFNNPLVGYSNATDEQKAKIKEAWETIVTKDKAGNITGSKEKTSKSTTGLNGLIVKSLKKI